MKEHKISLVVLFLSMIGTTLVPYLVGRILRLHKSLRRHSTPSDLLLNATVANHVVETALLSGTCQSFSMDMDQIDREILQSPTLMENILSNIIADEFFRTSKNILHPTTTPYCEPIPTRSGSDMNQQRLYCDITLPNAQAHIYTWPLAGTMSIDIFACHADKVLIALIPTIKNLVGINNKLTSTGTNDDEHSMVRWFYKLRGDRSDDGQSVYMHGDMDQFLCSYIDFDVKELVVSIDTEYQTIDVYDTIDPRFKTREQYYASLRKDDDSYYSAHPELFRPDRIIYLDGILQSRFYGDAAYHEPLVHPALFTHANPKRVAIIGGGEGATLREVLKHNTIETVTMIEIDELMVNVSRQYIPEWSDCSMIVGSTSSCFDDPRAEMFYTDGIAWFIDRYLNADTIDDSQLYDIIIMDALDPESSTEFSTVLYDTDDFMKSLSNSLRSDGILISQLGENFMYHQPGLHYTAKKIEYEFMQNLIEYGFDRMEDYTEAHGGFSGVWKYKIIFKCATCNYSRWHTTQAMLELEMKSRSMKCINDCNLFRFFDGATMMGYQYASRVNEAIFCRDVPQKLADRKDVWCDNSHGYDPDVQHYHSNNFDNQTILDILGDNESSGGLLAMIPALLENRTYVALDETTQNIIILPTTTNAIRIFTNALLANNINRDSLLLNRWKLWNTVLGKFGTPCTYLGSSCFFVSALLLKMNQSTNNTLPWHGGEDSATSWGVMNNISSPLNAVIYNPYISRNHLNFQWMSDLMNLAVSSTFRDDKGITVD